MQVGIVLVITFLLYSCVRSVKEEDVKLVQKMIGLVQQFRNELGNKPISKTATKSPDKKATKGDVKHEKKVKEDDEVKVKEDDEVKAPEKEDKVKAPEKEDESKAPGKEVPKKEAPEEEDEAKALEKEIPKKEVPEKEASGTEVPGKEDEAKAPEEAPEKEDESKVPGKDAAKDIPKSPMSASDKDAAKAILEKMKTHIDDISHPIILEKYSLEQIKEFYQKFEKGPAFGYALARPNFFNPANLYCKEDDLCSEKDIRAALINKDQSERTESKSLPFFHVLKEYDLKELITHMPLELMADGDAAQWTAYEEEIFKAHTFPIVPIIKSFKGEEVPLGIIRFDQTKEASFNEAVMRVKDSYGDPSLRNLKLPKGTEVTQNERFVEMTKDRVGLAILLIRIAKPDQLQRFTE